MIEKSGETYQFSKEHSQISRDSTAKQIKEKRSAYFGRTGQLDKSIRGFESEHSERELGISTVASEIAELSQYLDGLQSSILSKIGYWLEIERTRQTIDEKQSQYEVGSNELETIVSILADLRQQRLDRHELDEARQILGEFWQDQSVAWQEFQADEADHDVKNVCLANNCILVHGIHPTFTPGNNSLLDKGTTWQEKLKILLALEPVISTSTVHEGDDGNHNLWCKMGMILSGGRVESAYRGDRATKATGVKTRIAHGQESDQSDGIKGQIEKAIAQRGNGYNEFVVQDPEFSGFFVCLDPSDNPYDDPSRTMADLRQIAEMTKTLEIPLYIMRNGKFYHALVTEEGINYGEEVNIESLVKNHYDIDGKREELIEGILDGAPIKKELVANDEAAMVNGFFRGREAYLTLLARHMMTSGDFGKFEHMPYSSGAISYSADEGGPQLNPEQEVVFLPEVREGKERLQFLMYQMIIFNPITRQNEEQNTVLVRKLTRENQVAVYSAFSSIEDSGREYDFLIGLPTFEQKLGSYEDFFRQIEEMILEEIKNRQETLEKYGNDLWYRDGTLRINKLCFSLYGFAEEAGRLDDRETEKKAIELASKYFPYEQYQSIISSRLDEKGNFRLTKKDLAIAK